jgi:ectoine hydroxylase-related dioxygenase (phytanoyl-CoA dioxygenase family)
VTELETIENEAKQARHRLARGGYELVFAAASAYIAVFVLGLSIWSIVLMFAAFTASLIGIVDTIEGGTRYVLAKHAARQLTQLPAARVHRLPDRAIPPS